ncbi:MAG: RNA polymerase sigma-70 factor [Bacteroidota bacterium]
MGKPLNIEKWFMDYYAMLTAFAWKMVQEEELAKEIVQELFLHLFEQGEKLSIQASPKSYLFQAVRNRCINHLNKRSVSTISIDQTTEAENPFFFEDPMIAAEFEHQLYQWIKELPPACRQVFELSRFDGRSNAEIAAQLSISKRTVETQISKALRSLRRKLAAQDISESQRVLLFFGLV